MSNSDEPAAKKIKTQSGNEMVSWFITFYDKYNYISVRKVTLKSYR